MKLRKLKLIPEKKERNCTTGAHYSAKCPYCSKRIMAWLSEIHGQRRLDGTNKCPHFNGVRNGNMAEFDDSFSVTVYEGPKDVNVWVNGVIFGYWGIDRLIYELEDYLIDSCGENYSYNSLEKSLEKIYAISRTTGGRPYANERAEFLLAWLKAGKFEVSRVLSYDI